MVMAETQKSPESVRPTSACAPTDPPGLRRLRFPFFDLLVKERWGEAAATTVRLAAVPSLRKRSRSPGHPREASCSIRRLPAHCRAPVHGAQTPLISLTADPCQRVDEEFFARAHARRGRCACRKTARIASHTLPAGATANLLCSCLHPGGSRVCRLDGGQFDIGRCGTEGSDPVGSALARSKGATGEAIGGCTPGATHRWVVAVSMSATTSRAARTHVYLGRSHRPLGDIYVSDHADARQGGRFRWVLSTCLAAAVGVLAILVVIAGSTDTHETDGGLAAEPAARARGSAGLVAAALGATSTDCAGRSPRPTGCSSRAVPWRRKFVILDAVRQRRGSRDYIMNKPYARLVAQARADLQGGGPARAAIQSVQALRQYHSARRRRAPRGRPAGCQRQDRRAAGRHDTERGWPGARPPRRSPSLVGRSLTAADEPAMLRPGFAPEAPGPAAGDVLAERLRQAAPTPPRPTPRSWPRSVFEAEDAVDDLEGREVRVVKAQRGDTLVRILQRMGAETWQARAMSDAARNALPDGAPAARPGGARHAGALGGARQPHGADPLQRVRRRPGPQGDRDAQRRRRVRRQRLAHRRAHRRAPSFVDDDQPQASSLYASLHHTAERQGIPPDVILQILQDPRLRDGLPPARARRRRLRVLLRRQGRGQGRRRQPRRAARHRRHLGRRDAASSTASARPTAPSTTTTTQGNTSRKFLMRRPVRGEDVRITSGFGVRRHPILQIPKMHTGVDWACATGTPIMAAGSGVIEEVGPQGRIRQLHPHPPRQRLQDRLRPHVALRPGRGRGRQGAPGPDHRLRRHHRPVVGSARALRGARQQQLRRPDVDPGAARAPARRASSSPTSRRSARASTT